MHQNFKNKYNLRYMHVFQCDSKIRMFIISRINCYPQSLVHSICSTSKCYIGIIKHNLKSIYE